MKCRKPVPVCADTKMHVCNFSLKTVVLEKVLKKFRGSRKRFKNDPRPLPAPGGRGGSARGAARGLPGAETGSEIGSERDPGDPFSHSGDGHEQEETRPSRVVEGGNAGSLRRGENASVSVGFGAGKPLISRGFPLRLPSPGFAAERETARRCRESRKVKMHQNRQL